jgi:hypothetical protein
MCGHREGQQREEEEDLFHGAMCQRKDVFVVSGDGEDYASAV